VTRVAAADEVEAVTYPSVVEVTSMTEAVEVETGIGENGWVVNVTRFGVVVASCALELSEASVVEHSVAVTTTVVVKRVVNPPLAAEVSVLADMVSALSEVVSEYSGASVTVAVEYVVEEAMSVTSAPLEVEVAAAASVVVDSLSEKVSPSGMLISGMSEAAGVLVTVERPVSTASVVVVATVVLETSSPLWLS